MSAVPGKKRQRLIVAATWLAILIGYFAFTRSQGLSALEAAEELRSLMADNWWGPALFIVAYVARPLLLFPASVLTILGGLAFGLFWGIVWTVLAATLSTASMYGAGRYFGSETSTERLGDLLPGSFVADLIARLKKFPFETTVIMRLLYLPFDAVGYVCGFLRLRFTPFIAGSMVGTVPGTAAFVGFGASIDSLDEGTPSFDLRILLASVALAIGGSLFAKRLRRQQVEEVTTSEEVPV
jgi:uncharacterized membrane protein YdjX (TVP38/TMEM64 family)